MHNAYSENWENVHRATETVIGNHGSGVCYSPYLYIYRIRDLSISHGDASSALLSCRRSNHW
jgi:hypothetical protein